MRRLSLCVLLLALALAPAASAAVGVGHSGWQWGNPQPQGNSLHAIDFAGGAGYAAGSFGTLLKTTDGGLNWTALSPGTTATFTRVRAVDESTVFAGGGCALRRSDDGGSTFSRVAAVPRENSCPATVRSFSFVNGQTGYVLLSDGTVQRTDDGGASFAARAALPGTAALGAAPASTPTDIWFRSADVGAASAGGSLYRTTDGGVNWRQVFTGGAQLNGLYLDGDSGYAAGDAKTVLETQNAGETWTARTVAGEIPAADLTHVDCAPGNPNRCVFSTEQGDQLVRTTNGANSFTSVRPSAAAITAAAFNTNQSAVAVGEGGATALSANGGADWAPVGSQLSGTFTRLRAGAGGIYATGEDGALLRTSNGGEDWSRPGVATSEDVIDVTFPTDAVGYALDAAGDVRKTVDGGAHWTPVRTGLSGKPRSILATDADTVFLVGPRGVARSQRGGRFAALRGGEALRRSVLSDFDRAGKSLFFYGSRALFIADPRGPTLKRVRRPGGRRDQIAVADFVTARVGFVLGTDGRLWTTGNRGRTWSELRGTGTAGAYDMAFGDGLNGYLAVRRVGTSRAGGYALRTADGGRTWRPQLIGPSPLRAGGLVAVGSQSAFALADGNQLFHTASGGEQGARTAITIRSGATRFRRARRVTVTGQAAPGATVYVSFRALGGRRWIVRRATASSTGAFSARIRLTRSTVAVAQWLGQPGRGGDGSRPLVIRKLR